MSTVEFPTQEIWLGDSAELVHQLPDKVDCIITDPPYGVDFRSRSAVRPEGKGFATKIEGDKDLDAAIALFKEVITPVIERMPEGDMYVFTRWDIVGEWIQAVRDLSPLGINYKMMLIWDKGVPGMGDVEANWGCGHELILYCKKGRRPIPYRRSGIITVEKLGPKQHIHPTEKPVGLIERLMEMSTDPGDLVVDPFSGSGSTAVAAQRLGRSAIGIEKDPVHYRRSLPRLDQQVLPL